MMCKEKSFVLIIVAVLFALGIYSGIVHAEPDIYAAITPFPDTAKCKNEVVK